MSVMEQQPATARRRYTDEYRRVDGRWLIHRTGYRRSFEYLVPLSDLPSLTLTARWWGTGGSSTLPAG